MEGWGCPPDITSEDRGVAQRKRATFGTWRPVVRIHSPRPFFRSLPLDACLGCYADLHPLVPSGKMGATLHRRSQVQVPDAVIEHAFARSGGRCECTRHHTGQHVPHHSGRWPRKFSRYGDEWEAKSIVPQTTGEPGSTSHVEALGVEILCLHCCRLIA